MRRATELELLKLKLEEISELVSMLCSDANLQEYDTVHTILHGERCACGQILDYFGHCRQCGTDNNSEEGSV